MPTVEASSGLLTSTNLYVDDSGGDGRPVVLIHGWPLSAEAWTGQVPDLMDHGYRVVRYDRRGFGRSDKPDGGYDYDQLADDLEAVLAELDLQDVTLVGFSMGGGEVARYVPRHGENRLRSVVFASAVPPYLAQTEDNPDGPLDDETANEFESGLTSDRDAFFDQFATMFFSVDGELKVSEQQRQAAITLCQQSDQTAALACMDAFGNTDFREDLLKITVPTLVLHGGGDGVVPFEGSGKRTAEAVASSETVVIDGAPHGCNVSHPEQWNSALLEFLKK